MQDLFHQQYASYRLVGYVKHAYTYVCLKHTSTCGREPTAFRFQLFQLFLAIWAPNF